MLMDWDLWIFEGDFGLVWDRVLVRELERGGVTKGVTVRQVNDICFQFFTPSSKP